MLYRSNSTDNTKEIARNLATTLKGGEVILLYGDLGAGKTVFTKGIAEGLGISDTVTSPTFTIMREYKGKNLILKHFDFYRLNDLEEAYAAGILEHIAADDQVTVIEWPEKLTEILPQYAVKVYINSGGQETHREIEIIQ